LGETIEVNGMIPYPVSGGGDGLLGGGGIGSLLIGALLFGGGLGRFNNRYNVREDMEAKMKIESYIIDHYQHLVSIKVAK